MNDDILKTNIELGDILSLIAKKQEVKSLELKNAMNLYLKIKEHTVRPATIVYYKESLQTTIKTFNELDIYETKQINQNLIDKYISMLILSGLKNVSVNKKIKNLNYMLKTLNEYDLIDMPQYKFKKLKEEETKIEIVKADDITKLIDYLPNLNIQQRLIILLLLSTGIRRNELVNITLENIDLNNSTIYLSYTKTGKPRFCFIDKSIKEILIEQINYATNKRSKYLFPFGNSHLTADAITSFFEKLKQKLDIAVLSPHKIRHLYATKLLKNGADIMAVKELLGHSSLRITQKYLDYTKEDLKKYNNTFNPLNELMKG